MCPWVICGSLLINEKISFFCLLNRFFCIINEESPSFAVSLIYDSKYYGTHPPCLPYYKAAIDDVRRFYTLDSFE